jgi:AraC-like DNA-binding protein
MEQFDENFVFTIENTILLKCVPSWRINEQRSQNCNFTYLTKGGAQYVVDGKAYELNAGDLLCLPRGCTLTAVSYSDRLMHCCSVDFSLRNAKGAEIRPPFPVVSHIGQKPGVTRQFTDIISTWQNKQPGSIIRNRGLFLLLFQHLMEVIILNTDTASGDFRVNRIIRHIQANYSKKITVRKMAEMTGLNSTYFGILFKQETGFSLNQYLTRTRVQNAEKMLASGEYSVSKAADACGFSDEIHFYKSFKKMLGIPPSRYIPKRME